MGRERDGGDKEREERKRIKKIKRGGGQREKRG